MRSFRWALPFLAVLAVLMPTASWAYPAKVVGVHDGDTITVLDASKAQHKIRLASIDAPELGQPYGKNARQTMADLVFGRMVEIEPATTDRYGRTVAVVLVDKRNVNRAMVKAGAAWAYIEYLTDPVLVDLEADAGAAKRGLWALQVDQITPPWEWRKSKNKVSATDPSSPASNKADAVASAGTGGFTCSTKRVCRQMNGCTEAQFYLTQCGLDRLDGDHDGVPCEKICH